MRRATVRIIGGLGNQLHCYAFGRAIAAQNGAILELDTESGYLSDPFKRQYLLDAFPLPSFKRKTAPKTKVAQLMFKVKIRCGIVLSSKLPLSIRAVISEESPYCYREDIHHTKYISNPYFIGYWATYRYYQDIVGELRRDLIPPKPVASAALRMLDRINSERSCSIHWRSYKEDVGVFHPSLIEYYRNAIEVMEKKYTNIRYFVFSDEQALAQKELNFLGANATFVDIPATTKHNQALTDFYLMYSCDHAIIADSTFSWWAAWLSDHDEKVIIAPRGLSPWGDDWIPPRWISINAQTRNEYA